MSYVGSIYCGDNLVFLKVLPSNSIDLIYIDPPFCTGKDWGDFNDKWGEVYDKKWLDSCKDIKVRTLINTIGVVNGEKDKSYLVYMAMRLIEMHRVLKKTGSIYLHCDQVMVHSLKLLMDAIFKRKNFESEIIWRKENVGGLKSVANNWIKDHDNILFYSKGNKLFYPRTSFNYKKESLRRFTKTDEKGKYFIHKQMKNKKYYLHELKGKKLGDVWKMHFGSAALERTGYSTQKPLKLLERIINASSKEGDVVADFFCGSGTTLETAEKLGRKWIGSDINKKACEMTLRRVNNINPLFSQDIDAKIINNLK